MKKLMIAAAIVCAAVAANAAVANWKFSAVSIYNGTGSSETTAKYSGTAYLFDAGITTQSALFDLWLAGKDPIGTGTAGYVTSGTVANGGIAATTFSYGEQSTAEQTNTYKYYVAIVDGTADKGGKMYFSQVLTKNASQTSTAVTAGFGSQASGSQPKPTGIGYAGESKWSSPAPEPTSALLMLLGMAGLALRRKQK